jgi:hypothetical protein
MTNAETTDKAATIAEQSAHIAPDAKDVPQRVRMNGFGHARSLRWRCGKPESWARWAAPNPRRGCTLFRPGGLLGWAFFLGAGFALLLLLARVSSAWRLSSRRPSHAPARSRCQSPYASGDHGPAICMSPA